MAEVTIPGGDDKGKRLADAADSSITYWQKRMEADLEKDPNGRFAVRNRAFIDAAKAEMAERAKSGKRIAKPAGGGASTALQKQNAPAIEVLGRAMHDAVAVTGTLRKLAEHYHLVAPATSVDCLPPGCGVAISAVLVDTDPKNKEIYKVGDSWALSAVVLSKIWAAAGGSWDPEHTGRLDDGSDVHYCHYRAVGTAFNFDGSLRVVTGEVEIDARDGSPQILEIITKAKAREAEPDYRGKKDGGASQILELRKFLLRHAERKAKSRAVADLGLARAYTVEQLAKPFAVTRLMFTGDSDDPTLRHAFAMKTAEKMLGSRALLYGNPPERMAPPAGHAVPPPEPFRGHAPPPATRAPINTTAEPAPAPPKPQRQQREYGAPTPEELAESERQGNEDHEDPSIGDDDIPF